jgi:hypothetical protein
VTDDVVNRIDPNGTDTWTYTTHYDFNAETVGCLFRKPYFERMCR